MGCCFCCLSEADKVGRVLDKFPPVPVSQAQDNALQKLVGRIVLAGNSPFYAPGSGSPCVWYRTRVYEERREVRSRKDADGNWHEDVREYWHEIARDEQFVDFYIQDGNSRVFISGSRGGCKIQGTKEYERASIFNFPPPGIARMIADRCMMDAMFSWNHMLSGRTGRFRYTEESFDVNELLAALGVPTPATDPYTNQPVKILNAFTSSTVSERYMEDHEWSSWDKQSWKDLLKRPEILLSDHDRFTGGVFVANISNLPPFMTQQMVNQQQQQQQQQQYAQQPQYVQQQQQQPQYAQPQYAQPQYGQPQQNYMQQPLLQQQQQQQRYGGQY